MTQRTTAVRELVGTTWARAPQPHCELDLRAMRESRGLTVSQAARRLASWRGTSPRTYLSAIPRWEAGDVSPTLALVLDYCEALGMRLHTTRVAEVLEEWGDA